MDESDFDNVVDPKADWSEASLAPARRLDTDQLIAERYRIIRMIGQGGMGCVYLVEQIFLHREFALKTMNPGNLSPIAWRRFQKEARATVALDHPGLIKVHDFGMIEEGQPFFVMDYFGGETLANIIQQTGPLSISRALPIFIQACYALAHAHELGVIHRDIKPSNIMVLEKSPGDFDVRVVDFGIAKLVNTDSPESIALTRTGEIFGTPYYMSPEQCIGAAIDQRSDIYSLGCVMFQVLSGMPPYIGDSALAIMMQHQSESPPNLKEASLGRTFPDAIDAVIRKMVEKNPEARYQNLTEVAKDLELIKAGQKVTVPDGTRVDPPAPNKRSRRLLELVSVGAICLMAGYFGARLTISEQMKTSSPLTTQGVPAPTARVPYRGQFFSETATSDRLFHFPDGAEQTLGILTFPPGVDCFQVDERTPSSRIVTAKGDLQTLHFRPFELEVSEYLCQHPDLFSRFRADEVSSLRIRNAHIFGFTDDTWRYCSNLKKSLVCVQLPDSESITDGSVYFLNELPNLVSLSIENSGFTGFGAAKLKRLRLLESLKAEGIKYPEMLLNSLRGSSNITDLAIRVTDKTVDSLLSLPNLNVLTLGNATGVTKKGLEKIAQLKKLRKLTLYNPYEASADTLKCFGGLEELAVVVEPNEKLSSYAEQRKLQHVLNKTRVSVLVER